MTILYCYPLELLAQRPIIKSYSVSDGLVANPVIKMFQDSKGFIWFCTWYGLSKYDGTEFQNFTIQNGLSSNLVNDIIEREDGLILAATSTDQIDAIKDGQVQNRQAIKSIGVGQFFSNQEGQIFASTGNHGIITINDTNWQTVSTKYSGIVTAWEALPNGGYLMGGGFYESGEKVTILYFLNEQGEIRASLDNDYRGNIKRVFIDEYENIWIATEDGLMLTQADKEENGIIQLLALPRPFNHQLLQKAINDLLKDRHGNFWFATRNGLIFIDSLGNLNRLTVEDGLPSDNVLSLLEDREGNIWIGTVNGVVQIPVAGHIAYYRTKNGLAENDLQDVLPINNQTTLITTYNGVLQKVDIKEIAVNTIAEKTPGFFRFFELSKQQYAIGHGSKSQWRGDELFKLDMQLGIGEKILDFPPSFFNVIKGEEDFYYLSSPSGLYFYNNRTKDYQILAGIEQRINAMLLDHSGFLWAGTLEGDLYRLELQYQEDKISTQIDTLTSLINANGFKNIFEDSDQFIWIATRYQGLKKLAKNEEGKYQLVSSISTPEGLLSFASSVEMEDGQSNLWVVSQLGIDKLVSTTNSSKQQRRVFSFSKEYNLFNEVNKLRVSDAEVFWAATSTGLIRFTDPQVDTLAAPTVYITQVKNKQLGLLNLPLDESKIILPHSNSDLEISFTSPSFVNEKSVRYSYRLKGHSNQSWSDPSTRPFFSTEQLVPGNYTFEVAAVKWDGTMGERAGLQFSIKPPWWQNPVLYVLGCLTILAIAYFLIKRRIQHIWSKAELQQKIIETEMKALRAQMNPHFIFNCINNIDAFIQNKDRYNATVYLNKFAKLLRNVLDSSNQKLVPLSKDVETLRLYVELENLRENKKMNVRIDVEEFLLQGDYHVPPLIIQPFVENAIIHGLRPSEKAIRELDIVIKKQGMYLQYLIRDNGVGREALKKYPKKEAYSYGIQMVKDRVQRFNNEELPAVEIIDLVKDGIPDGTKVEVLLKVD